MSKFLPLALFIIIFAYFQFQKSPDVQITIKEKAFTLEIARTLIQKSKGLSGRQNLCQNCGMIFIYNTDLILPFWMKNTLIPLDIIWINSQSKVVSIQTASPELDKPDNQLKIYQNDQPASFVIEFNAGTAADLGLQIGDIITIPEL